MIVTTTCQDALGKRKVWLFSGIDAKAQSRNPARSSGSSGAASVLRDSPRVLRDFKWLPSREVTYPINNPLLKMMIFPAFRPFNGGILVILPLEAKFSGENDPLIAALK